MYIFFEKDMRGGVSYISNSYIKANNKYLKSYDPKKELRHIIYLDTNNLYSYAMPSFFWTSGFKWVDPKERDLNTYTSNTSKNCVLEVDLEYPTGLRELHNDYLLASKKKRNQKRNAIWVSINFLPNFLIKKNMWFIMKTWNFTWDYD